MIGGRVLITQSSPFARQGLLFVLVLMLFRLNMKLMQNSYVGWLAGAGTKLAVNCRMIVCLCGAGGQLLRQRQTVKTMNYC